MPGSRIAFSQAEHHLSGRTIAIIPGNVVDDMLDCLNLSTSRTDGKESQQRLDGSLGRIVAYSLEARLLAFE